MLEQPPPIIDTSGLSVTNQIGLWPFSDEPVRIWVGDIKLNASKLEGKPVTYKLRCSCKQKYIAFWKCTGGKGTIQTGEFHVIHIKLPEMAIYNSRVHLLIDGRSIEISLYKLPKADKFYWGIDTDVEKEKEIVDKRPEWSTNNSGYAYEMISHTIKPLLKNVPHGLQKYIEGSSESPIRNRIYNLVHEATLDVLSDLGLVALNMRAKKTDTRECAQTSGRNTSYDGDLVECILIRLSEILRKGNQDEVDSHPTQNGTKDKETKTNE